MKESRWDECITSGSSLPVSPDIAKSRSLIDTAKGRIDFLKLNKIETSNANYIFEGYYSSALEMLHAFVIKKGYKVSNHICLGYYLRDVMKREDLYRIFDNCRYKRNSLVYYGRKMPLETAKETIRKCISFIDALEDII
ncbi:MAG: hypothetical protein KAJ56_03150 [Candidatus Aenigmarchaeota archaeon]|nr:hypothetical protein [Candidatus Aenigmarchaeota archaeon]